MIPLALPYSSVIIDELKVVKEFPATPVNLASGFAHLPIFLFSINTLICVFGFNLLRTNLTGIDLAKNFNESATDVPLTVLYPTPFAISLFCGLTFEELPTDAVPTADSESDVLFSARELML